MLKLIRDHAVMMHFVLIKSASAIAALSCSLNGTMKCVNSYILKLSNVTLTRCKRVIVSNTIINYVSLSLNLVL